MDIKKTAKKISSQKSQAAKKTTKPTPKKLEKKAPQKKKPSDSYRRSGEKDAPISGRVSSLLKGLSENLRPEKEPESEVSEKSAPTSGLFDGVTDFAGDVFDGARDRAGDLVENGTEVAGGILDKVVDVAEDARDGAGSLLDKATDKAGELVDGVTDRVGGLVEDGGDLLGRWSSRLFGNSAKPSSLAEERESDPTVAVIDAFGGNGGKPTHGDLVESIIQDNSNLTEDDVQRYRAGGTLGVGHVSGADDENIGTAFDEYVESFSADSLDGSSDAIEDILSHEDSSVRTINQSLAAPEVRITENLYNELGSDPEFRERYLTYAGLDSNASEKEILETLVSEVGESRRTNERVGESQERYDSLTKEAHDRGIVTVVAAGNHGRFADILESHGVEADDEFFRNNLANDHTLTVGATDGMNTSGASDDTEAAFTTPNAGAEIAAPGQDISTFEDGEVRTASGASFSAPQVAAAAAELAEAYPDLSASEIEAILIKSSERTGLDRDEIGYGVLDAEAANSLAEKVAA